MAKILVVDDNQDTLEVIKDLLQAERHTVDCSQSAVAAWDFIKTYTYDVFVFDWEMPEMSGTELLQKYRSSGGQTPVLMLTGRDATRDKITGLDSGADAYLTKPIDPEELLGFIRALLRRTPQGKTDLKVCGDLELSVCASSVTCGGKTAPLSARELAVLDVLLGNANRLISHDELKAVAWSDSPEISSGAVRVFLTGLRDKLNSIGSRIQILNVRGYGYQVRL